MRGGDAHRARDIGGTKVTDPDGYRPDDTPADPENITVPWDDEEDYR